MRVLQINSVCGEGSTGRIVTDLAELLHARGHACKIAYGRGEALALYEEHAWRIGSDLDVALHGALTRGFDVHGFASRKATVQLVEQIKQYAPDLIHLHNLHGYYLHLEVLFRYLKQSRIPVVWTLHDCWAFTGHCAHFAAAGCARWETGCFRCPQRKNYPRAWMFDRSKANFQKKRAAFDGLENMTLVTPSRWLADVTRRSFLGRYPIKVIYNGIDLETFRPTPSDFRQRYALDGCKMLLGVSAVWNEAKGLGVFSELSRMTNDTCRIVLVGTTAAQKKALPRNILCLPKVQDPKELAKIYSAADIFINPSVQESLGLTTAEALACGTPVLTFDQTAVPEVPDHTCGISCSCSVQALLDALPKVDFTPQACVKRAAFFDKRIRCAEYLSLYEDILARR